jgi:hypothetical protein
MSKKILVNSKTKLVVDVADNEFEVHPSLVWYTVDNDNVDNNWTYNKSDGSLIDNNSAFLESEQGQRYSMVQARLSGYGSIGNQLDTLYKDMRDGTNIWVDKITAVKNNIPKVPSVDSFDE